MNTTQIVASFFTDPVYELCRFLFGPQHNGVWIGLFIVVGIERFAALLERPRVGSPDEQ